MGSAISLGLFLRLSVLSGIKPRGHHLAGFIPALSGLHEGNIRVNSKRRETFFLALKGVFKEPALAPVRGGDLQVEAASVGEPLGFSGGPCSLIPGL